MMTGIIIGGEYDIEDPRWGKFRGVVEEVDGRFIRVTVTKGPARHKYLPLVPVGDSFWFFVELRHTKMEPVT